MSTDIKATLDAHPELKAALIKAGWLPPEYATSAMLALLDASRHLGEG